MRNQKARSKIYQHSELWKKALVYAAEAQLDKSKDTKKTAKIGLFIFLILCIMFFGFGILDNIKTIKNYENGQLIGGYNYRIAVYNNAEYHEIEALESDIHCYEAYAQAVS